MLNLAISAWMRALVARLPDGWLPVAVQAHDAAPMTWTHVSLKRDDISRCARAGLLRIARRRAPDSKVIEYVIRRAQLMARC
jgi:hypothetical protein